MQVLNRLFTRSNVYAMLEAGILQEDERLELINGELVTMPSDPLHGGTIVDFAEKLRHELTPFGVRIREEKDFWLPDIHQLYLPDIAVVKPFNHLKRHPEPSDTYLIVEVAYSSLSKGITDKLPNYLAAGIREVWIVDLKQSLIRVYRQDQAPFEVAFGKAFAPFAFPDAACVWL
jgi:Uma2 family endonuclease